MEEENERELDGENEEEPDGEENIVVQGLRCSLGEKMDDEGELGKKEEMCNFQCQQKFCMKSQGH
jgi:hypothetical protein